MDSKLGQAGAGQDKLGKGLRAGGCDTHEHKTSPPQLQSKAKRSPRSQEDACKPEETSQDAQGATQGTYL